MHYSTLPILLLATFATALPTANPQTVGSDPDGTFTCVAEVLGNPSAGVGSWVVQVVLRNEISMEKMRSAQEPLELGDDRTMGGLGPDVTWKYVATADQQADLDMSYAEFAWKWSQCAVYTDDGIPFRRCTFPCRG